MYVSACYPSATFFGFVRELKKRKKAGCYLKQSLKHRVHHPLTQEKKALPFCLNHLKTFEHSASGLLNYYFCGTIHATAI